MAKAKKLKPQVEEKVEPVIEETVPIEMEPPSVTLDKVKEADISEPEIVAEPEAATPEVLVEPEETATSVSQTHTVVMSDDLTMAEKVLKYLDERPRTEIRMNDFLKSLFKPPKFGELPIWQSQSANKEVKSTLDKLQLSGELEVISNAHLNLGTTYYPDTSTMRSAKHDLNSVSIFVRKVN